MSRDVCYKCLKAKETCYCHKISQFKSYPEFVILLHSKERKMKTNTGRMVNLSIENSYMFEGLDFSQHEKLNSIIDDPKRAVYILFPGEGSIRIDQDGACEKLQKLWTEQQKLPTFVIIDGTWANAKKMLRLNPKLRKLPFISFVPNSKSNFRIRKQPMDLCYSTIETTHYLLTLFKDFNKQKDLDSLLVPFDFMVEMQIDYEMVNRKKRQISSEIKDA